jgi:hypothetical protein
MRDKRSRSRRAEAGTLIFRDPRALMRSRDSRASTGFNAAGSVASSTDSGYAPGTLA